MASSVTADTTTNFTLHLLTSNEEEQVIYVVGNFNRWRVADERFRMQRIEPGYYRLELPLVGLPEILEYKYARGTWDHVELGDEGHDRPNRQALRSRFETTDHVQRWKQDRFSYPDHLLPRIEIIEQDFEMPAQVQTRRIAALLPHDYHETDRSYPVLYLQDGQNLFDDYAPYGNWAVDKHLARLRKEGKGDIIVIAIDHAMDKRIVEFTPSTTTSRFGKGQGKEYVRFLAERLKPYVDRTYRTLPGCEHTGIGGSSMGGLISIYAGMMYPKVYGRLMIFSPSLWMTPNIRFQLLNLNQPFTGRAYLYGGTKESATMIPNLERLKKVLEKHAGDRKPEFHLSIDPEGEHNEARWGEEFPAALTWLFFYDKITK